MTELQLGLYREIERQVKDAAHPTQLLAKQFRSSF